MKIKNYSFFALLLFFSFNFISGQVVSPFYTRIPGGSIKVKGDIVFVGNNIINRTTSLPTGFDANGFPLNLAALTVQANTPYNAIGNNNNQNLEYIDIDNDAATFSSSNADLAISNSCKKIVYAGLYWTASYVYDRAISSSATVGTPIKTDWNQIKFKIPGGNYINIVADNAADPVGDEDSIILSPTLPQNLYNRPYVCYKNVTGLLQSLIDANGQYFVANQRASKGVNPNGNSAGWNMVVIYESPNLPSKFISTFDGFATIKGGEAALDFNINGFQTLPAPLPVKAKIGIGALEGDRSITGDNLSIKANSLTTYTTISNGLNPLNNFFNSSITDKDIAVTNRLPASNNTLGFDLDQIIVTNPGNTVVPNGETSATFRLTDSSDSYAVYLATFAVDIIEPKILLTNTIKNVLGTSIEGAEVNLCQDLIYEIGFQNVGNDNATSFQIKDVLPINVTFNPATDLILPAGVALSSYNTVTRELILNIANNLVEINDPRYEIRIRVKVACSCSELSDACSNVISNQAFATYRGLYNTSTYSNEGSFASLTACNSGTPTATNVLINTNNCTYTSNVTYCGTNVQLKAKDGYQTYQWSGPAGATFLPNATSQIVTVNMPGDYTVLNETNSIGCRNITQLFNVSEFSGGSTITNPILNYNENLPIQSCPNDGLIVPHIYLCGTNDSRLLQTNYTETLSIIWEKLNSGDGCAPSGNALCSNNGLSNNCWTQVSSEPNFTVSDSGEYRIVVTFQGNCSSTFYFNVYKNKLNPTFTANDISCTTLGQITINNVPNSGYEFSLSSPTGSELPYIWQNSNVFNAINTQGIYKVSIRQTGVANACIFSVPNIEILKRDIAVTSTVMQQPLCSGDKGSILLVANNVAPQYTFSLSLGNILVGTYGPTTSNIYNFTNLNSGNYIYTVSSIDGCSVTGIVNIVNPPQLAVMTSITKPITNCSDGEITIYATGGISGSGTPPLYNYIVTHNGTTTSTTNPVIPAGNTGGLYEIQVVDLNNCISTTTVTLLPTVEPTFSPTVINSNCYGDTTGIINFNVISPTGTMQYSINGGANFSTNPIFTNLSAGTYSLVIQYTVLGTTCTTTPAFIVLTSPTFNSIDQSVVINNGTYTANQADATYQWFNCNTNIAIEGATNQSFQPTISGSYKVQITNSLGCSSFSNCIQDALGTNNFNKIGIKTFPNPVKETFTIEGDIIIKNLAIYNLLGQKIASYKGNVKVYSIKDLTSGSYIIQLETDKGTSSSMIIKE